MKSIFYIVRPWCMSIKRRAYSGQPRPASVYARLSAKESANTGFISNTSISSKKKQSKLINFKALKAKRCTAAGAGKQSRTPHWPPPRVNVAKFALALMEWHQALYALIIKFGIMCTKAASKNRDFYVHKVRKRNMHKPRCLSTVPWRCSCTALCVYRWKSNRTSISIEIQC